MGEIKVFIWKGEGRGTDLEMIGSTCFYYLHRNSVLNCVAMRGSFLGCQLLLRDDSLSPRLSTRSIFSILGSSWLVLNENPK